jgi:hypothetical protein
MCRLQQAVKMRAWHTRRRPLASAAGVWHEAGATEVHLALGPRRRVVDSDGGAGPAPSSAALDAEPGEGAVRDHHPLAGEQDADLDHNEPVGHPVLVDLLLVGDERSPRLAVAVGPTGAAELADLADHLVGQLFDAAVAVDAEGLGSGDVAPDGAPAEPRSLVRGHEKVLACGHFEVPAGGQREVLAGGQIEVLTPR